MTEPWHEKVQIKDEPGKCFRMELLYSFMAFIAGVLYSYKILFDVHENFETP
jgi:hypothetical protein